MNDGALTVEIPTTFKVARVPRHCPEVNDEPASPLPARVPRVARLMALAIRIDGLVRDGRLRDYADAARLGHVTRARMAQIVGLLNLAPDIQEALLFLTATRDGRDPVGERELRVIAVQTSWTRQRETWIALSTNSIGSPPGRC